MNRDQAMEYIRGSHKGVLSTVRSNGRAQLSNVSYLLDDDGLIKISVTQDRIKTRNVRRDPRVSMAVQGDDWYRYVVVEGCARIHDDNPLPELRHVYEGIRGGPHPNWEEFDEAMIRDRRAVMVIEIERLYPLDK